MRHWATGCAVAAAAMATSWNAHDNGFVWDDQAAVLTNADVVAGAGSSLSALWWHDFWGADIESHASHKSFRPLTVLTFRLNHWWNGLEPRDFHVVNTVAHTVCSVLVWYTGLALSAQYGGRSDMSSSRTMATVAGFLFAVHPIHCDAVASVVGRADLLCTAFSLMGFLSYTLAASSSRSPAIRWSAFALSLLTAVIGMSLLQVPMAVYELSVCVV